MSAAELFISILRAELAEGQEEPNASDILTSMSELYDISHSHGLSQVIAEYLSKRDLLADDGASKRFNEDLMKAVLRTERMKSDIGIITDILGSSEIPHILLKGAVLRSYYPHDYLRISGDIDILVHEEDVDRAIVALCNRGCKFVERTYHDILIMTPGNNKLELHFSLLEPVDKLNCTLERAWEFATDKSDFRYEFSDIFFIFHHLAHMMYHFTTSGCGVRFLCDLWVIENKMGIKVDDAKELLEKAQIYTFAREMSRLSRICFDGEEGDEISNAVFAFMLSGGVGGSERNTAAMAVASDERNIFTFAIGRMFPRYGIMKETYPSLRGKPMLLPFYWMYRIFCKLTSGKANSARNEIKSVSKVSEAEIANAKTVLGYLGLR